jgi:hypothetical protein
MAAAVLLAVVCEAAAAAPARDGIPASLSESQASEHFVVHYTTSDPAHAIPADSVPGILAIAEQAYAAEVNSESGFGPPLDDGDGRIDIYVHDLEEDVGIARGDRPTPDRPNQASAYIELDPQAAAGQGYQGPLHYILPHELFHVLQFAYSGREAPWMMEATAEWAVRSLAGVDFYARPEENWFRNPNQPLDCFGESCGGTPVEERATEGYDRWPFFRYLEERFGRRIVYEIWSHSRALSGDGRPHALEAIDAALRLRGASLSEMFGDFVTFAASAAWQLEDLRRWLPTPAGGISTGRSRTTSSVRIQVAHLAAAYVGLAGGGPPETLSICVPARLRLGVVQSPDQAEPPALVRLGERPYSADFAGAGGQRSLDVAWETCPRATGTAAFPNTNWSVDGVPFDFTAELTPARRLRLARGKPVVTFYLQLAARTRVRTELSLPPRRGRPVRRIVRSRIVREGARPLSLRLPRSAADGRYSLAVRFRNAGGSVTEARRSFTVRFR